MKTQKLIPFTTDYIWGGSKLKTEYGIKAATDIVAEAWLLSLHKDGESKTVEGKPLSTVLTDKDKGKACQKFSFFPVLVKLIDAKENLSVQVHPSDDYALKHENSFGKTEMWYVTDAEEGAGLYVGFKKEITRLELEKRIAEGTILEALNFFKVKKGDCFFINAGTVHAIGKGCTIAEVQQNSNLTYRLYDYNRLGSDGKPRALHLEKAAEVTDLSAYKPLKFKDGYLADCQYFSVILNNDGKTIYNENSFTNIIILEGEGEIDGIRFSKGESYFIPSGTKAEIIKRGNNELSYMEVFVK